MGVNFTPPQEPYKEYKSFDVFFKSFVLQNFPLIEEDFDSLTYYQMLSKIVGYMKDVIDNNKAIQDNQEAVLEAYNELQNYVNNYFDNLDVQTEINNKLDEMVQSGELQTLLNNLFADLREETETRLDEQNTRLNNMQNQVNAIAGGSPQVVTSTTQMSDTSKIYVLSTDGKWYYNNGTSWVTGGTYQPSSTSLDNIRNEIPLSTNTTNYFIKEIYLQGYDNSKNIEVRSLRKAWYDSAGDHRYHTDFTLKYSDDPKNASIGGFGYTRDSEASALQPCELKIYPVAQSSNSGISGYVIIDFSQLETGSRILNPSTHIVLNPNKYKFLPNNPSIENYITNQNLDDIRENYITNQKLDDIRNEIPLATNTHNMFIKEIYLENFDPTKQIELRSIRKAWYDTNGDHRYHTDFTLKYSDDPTNATLTGFGFTRDTESSALQLCEQKIYPLASSTSDVTGYAIIDFSQLETGSRILNPTTHVVLNPNKYKFLPNNPSIENYITNQKLNDYLPYIRQKFTNIYSFGHQGFGAGQNGYRGNSLTGFKKGAIFGFDSLECDIKVTSDNQLVLNHDPTITDDDGVTYTIAETTLAELKSHLYGGETICTLEECLNVCKTFGIDLSIDHVYTLLHNDEAYNRMKSLVYLYSMQEKIFLATLQMWRGGDVPPFHQKLCQDFPKATLIFKNEDTTWTNAKFDIVKEDYIDTYGMKVFVGGPYATTYSLENIRVAQQYPDIKIGFYTINDPTNFATIARKVDWITSDKYCGRDIVLWSRFLD